MSLARILRRRLAADQPALLEIAQQAAEISRIKVERAANVARCQLVAMCQLVQNAHLPERIGAVEVCLAQYADLLGVKPIESAYRRHCLLACHKARVGKLVDKVKYFVGSR